MSELRAILPQSKTLKKARYLKPTGRTLGGKAQWKSFLLAKYWQRLDFDFNQSIDLAAKQIYGRENLTHASPEIAKAKGKEELDTDWKAHRNCSTVRTGVDQIQKAIDSVFPPFFL